MEKDPKEKEIKEKSPISLRGSAEALCYHCFLSIETKFISVKTLISKPSITLLSENKGGTSTCSPDVKQRFLASNSQGLLRNKGGSLEGQNKSIK